MMHRLHRRTESDETLFTALAGDGRPLLAFVAIALLLSGAFALFQSATGHFLPHDVDYLGMTARELCARNECRIVHFMFHDRVSFGGVLLAVGILYLWLAAVPLRDGEPWAWWLFLVSGVLGFLSFLGYLGYGYLDTWHGLATLTLLPFYIIGLIRTRRLLGEQRRFGLLLRPSMSIQPRTAFGLGRLLICSTAAGLFVAGLVIMTVGMTVVFVPQDLAFMNIKVQELNAISPRLVPLIAHDRAGFGGGVACAAFLLFFCAWCGRPSRALWQAMAAAGAIGFGCAVGIHPLIGYTDFLHLAPAVAGALTFGMGMALTLPRRSRQVIPQP